MSKFQQFEQSSSSSSLSKQELRKLQKSNISITSTDKNSPVVTGLQDKPPANRAPHKQRSEDFHFVNEEIDFQSKQKRTTVQEDRKKHFEQLPPQVDIQSQQMVLQKVSHQYQTSETFGIDGQPFKKAKTSNEDQKKRLLKVVLKIQENQQVSLKFIEEPVLTQAIARIVKEMKALEIDQIQTTTAEQQTLILQKYVQTVHQELLQQLSEQHQQEISQMEQLIVETKSQYQQDIEALQKQFKKSDHFKVSQQNAIVNVDDLSDDSGSQLVQRLKAEIKELKVQVDIYQSDLHQQQHASEKLRKKLESEQENLSKQLAREGKKNSQAELIKDLLDRNSGLIKENKNLNVQLEKMSDDLVSLYEDAETVRQQVNNEINEYKQAQSQINILKKQNYILWKQIRLNEVNMNHKNTHKFDLDEDDLKSYQTELDIMAQDSGIFKDLKLKVKSLVHQGVQTSTEHELNIHSLDDRIDAILESNTKSIVGVITNVQMQTYHHIFNKASASGMLHQGAQGQLNPQQNQYGVGMGAGISELDLQNVGSFKGVPQFSQASLYDLNGKVIEFEFSEAASRSQF